MSQIQGHKRKQQQNTDEGRDGLFVQEGRAAQLRTVNVQDEQRDTGEEIKGQQKKEVRLSKQYRKVEAMWPKFE